MSELLPCPFCGGEMKHYASHEANMHFGGERPTVGWWEHPTWPDIAIKREATGCPAYAWRAWDDEVKRIAIWNRRTPLPTIPHNGTINATEKANG